MDSNVSFSSLSPSLPRKPLETPSRFSFFSCPSVIFSVHGLTCLRIGPPSQNSTGRVCRFDPFLGVCLLLLFLLFALYLFTFSPSPSPLLPPSLHRVIPHPSLYSHTFQQLQETILLPVSQVTSCVFGGPNLDQLYITTRRKPGEPNSGGIYVAKRLGVTGAYPSLYNG